LVIGIPYIVVIETGNNGVPVMFIFYVYHSSNQITKIIAADFDSAEAIASKLFQNITNINKWGRA